MTRSAAGRTRDHGLGQQPEHEERQGRGAGPLPAGRVEPEIGEHRGGEEHSRQRVLQLGDPGDRLDVDGVQGEHGRGQQRPLDLQRPEDREEQQRRGEVERDVDEVVPERVVAPEPVLDPEGGVGERVVLLGRPELEPDSPEPVERLQLRTRHVRGVVPEPLAVPGRSIREERHDQQDQQEKPGGCPAGGSAFRRSRGCPAPSDRSGALLHRLIGLNLGDEAETCKLAKLIDDFGRGIACPAGRLSRRHPSTGRARNMDCSAERGRSGCGRAFS